LFLRAIATHLSPSRDTEGKYVKSESPATRLLSIKERAKTEARTEVQIAAE
jgi:hypothetical protein